MRQPMPVKQYDVIVAGVGAMGSAACFHLARRGVRVLGLDAHSTPNELGSSGGQSRMIRLSYYEHSDYVPLLVRSYELWDELCAVTTQSILRRTGGLYMGLIDSPFLQGSARSAREHGISHEMLERQALRERFPQFELPDEFVGIYEPNAGVIATGQAIAAHLHLAIDFGAEIHAHEPILSWHDTDHGVEVETHAGRYAADQMVVTVGSWTNRLLRDLDVPLTVTRQVVGWVWPRTPEMYRIGRFPVWAIEDAHGPLNYGFPLMDDLPGPLGIKVAQHGGGTPVDPESVDRTIGAEDERSFREPLRRYLPSADGPLTGMSVCMYTNSPDGHFIVDRMPDRPHVVFACGFSGHGFKFCPVIGEALADLATSGHTRLPIDFIGLDRFRTTAGDGAGAASTRTSG